MMNLFLVYVMRHAYHAWPNIGEALRDYESIFIEAHIYECLINEKRSLLYILILYRIINLLVTSLVYKNK